MYFGLLTYEIRASVNELIDGIGHFEQEETYVTLRVNNANFHETHSFKKLSCSHYIYINSFLRLQVNISNNENKLKYENGNFLKSH